MEIMQPGVFTTVQDTGRLGNRQYGVVASGAVDPFAHHIANLLVGNQASDATLECTLVGPTIRLTKPVVIALTGGYVDAKVNGVSVPMWRPVYVAAEQTLDIGPVVNGCRVYLSVAGGLQVPSVLGSRSTDTSARFGGWQGRALQRGDDLTSAILASKPPWFAVRPTSAAVLSSSVSEVSMDSASIDPGTACWPNFAVSKQFISSVYSGQIRCMRGTHFEYLCEESQDALFNMDFTVTLASDRMGMRLSSPFRLRQRPGVPELISEGVTVGTVQLPSGGQPVVLLPNCQTTGGYPRMAHVATPDLPKLAQRRPGETLRFEEIDVSQANQLIQWRYRELKVLHAGLRRTRYAD